MDNIYSLYAHPELSKLQTTSFVLCALLHVCGNLALNMQQPIWLLHNMDNLHHNMDNLHALSYPLIPLLSPQHYALAWFAG